MLVHKMRYTTIQNFERYAFTNCLTMPNERRAEGDWTWFFNEHVDRQIRFFVQSKSSGCHIIGSGLAGCCPLTPNVTGVRVDVTGCNGYLLRSSAVGEDKVVEVDSGRDITTVTSNRRWLAWSIKIYKLNDKTVRNWCTFNDTLYKYKIANYQSLVAFFLDMLLSVNLCMRYANVCFQN